MAEKSELLCCPICGGEEIRIEVNSTVVVPFRRKVKVDEHRPVKRIRQARCAECSWSIRDLVAIS